MHRDYASASSGREKRQRLVLHAYEAGCEVVAFSRDRDSDPDRDAAIERGIAAAKAAWPEMGVIGGIARPCIEGWVRARVGGALHSEGP